MRKLAILGAGSWGLTLSWLLAHKTQEGCAVTLWDRSPDKIQRMQANRQVTFPVPVTLPDALTLTSDFDAAVEEADALLLVVSTAGTRETARRFRQSPAFSPKTIIINASKGIEYPGLKTMGEVIAEELPENPFAVLSGPTLAKEILAGLPTACSIASRDADVAEQLQADLSRNNCFRLYSNTDVIGVELGGSLKNIFAIASGYMQARQLGENARAALITRGLAEMNRISLALGAEEQTIFGLSGLGDLLATCNSPLSRNYQVGYQLGQGRSLEQILADLKVVAEGVQTTHAVSRLSERLKIDTPIVQQVELALTGVLSEEMMIRSLMSRRLKSE